MRLEENAVIQEGLFNAERLVPHRHGMKLIKRIKKPAQQGFQAETTVSESWPMYERGAVSSIICVELIAQSVSAFATWLRGPNAIPRIGLLVGIKRADFSTATMPIDIDLTITVDEISRLGNYGIFKGEVASHSTSFCSAVIQALDPDRSILEKINEQTPVLGGKSMRFLENDE